MLKYRPLTINDLETVRAWRMKPRVTRFMKTDPVITEDAQLDWFYETKDAHFIITSDNKDIGLLTFCKPTLGVSSYGFYIGDDDMQPLGGFVPAFAVSYLLRPYSGIDKVEIEIAKENENVVKLHERLGFKFLNSFTHTKGDAWMELCTYTLKRSEFKPKQIKVYGSFT